MFGTRIRVVSSSFCIASSSLKQRRVVLLNSFHSSAAVYNKKGGKGGKGSAASDSGNETAVALPDVKAYDKGIDNTIIWLSSEFSKLKVGKISADVFSNLYVESYGTVGKAGQVTLKSNTKLVVSVYDPAIANAVAEAIRNCGMSINPTVEGSNVLANIPRPSKESRDAIVKNVSKLSEKAKQDVRNARKTILDNVKKIKSSISEDDMRRFSKEVENVTEKKLDKISQLTKAKESEVASSD